MKYFFHLGNNINLSIAEILSIFPQAKNTKLLGNIFLIELSEEINAKKIMHSMGGSIKIGLLEGEANKKNLEKTIFKILENKVKKTTGKFKLGFSCYGKGKLNIKPLAMESKKFLREQGSSCRWVTSREPVLSSVVVGQNKLIENGTEIVLINDKDKILVGQTLAIQPFKELSFRDYSRPARDDHSGMLPPKLAQIMINLAGQKKDAVLLDPFCGSGTILTEASLMGYKNLIGSDISEKAINDTEKNIGWIFDKFNIKAKYGLYNESALDLGGVLKKDSVDAIVTEPYLGPQRGKVNTKKIKQELDNLYTKSLQEFKKILKTNGIVIMIWPVLKSGPKDEYINPDIKGYKNITSSKLIYGRPGQKVWRNIVILKKN